MTQQQINNLKSLIQTSNILSGSEKTEWLGLLELMDDKQLGELEKILLIGKKQAQNQPEIKPQAVHLPSINTPVKPEPVQAQMPKLSHIVNLPRIGNMQKVAEPKLAVEPPKPIVKIQANQVIQNVKPTPQKQAGGFLAKLKSMLAEKELPSGHTKNELELPEKALSHTTVTNSMPVELPKPVIKPQPPIIPQPKLIVADKVILEGPVVKPVLKNQEQLTLKTSGIIHRPSVNQTLNIAKPLGYKPEQLAKPQLGVSFAKDSEANKNSILSEIKSHLDQKTVLGGSVLTPKNNFNLPEEKLNTDINLETLEDLTGLNKKFFTTSDFTTVVRKIKLIVQKSGYHTALFSIEKSPLYKAYIQTGSEILDNKASFDSQDKESSENYLNRQIFEKFADLLRQIQVS